MIVVNPVINSSCAFARWLMDSSRACTLGSRIVRLRTKASLSTFLTVIAKIKRSCDCAQWLIVHIACVVVVKDNAQYKMKLMRLRMRDLTPTYVVVAAFVLSPTPLHVGQYTNNKRDDYE